MGFDPSPHGELILKNHYGFWLFFWRSSIVTPQRRCHETRLCKRASKGPPKKCEIRPHHNHIDNWTSWNIIWASIYLLNIIEGKEFLAKIDVPFDSGGYIKLTTPWSPNVTFWCQAQEGLMFSEFGVGAPQNSVPQRWLGTGTQEWTQHPKSTYWDQVGRW